MSEPPLTKRCPTCENTFSAAKFHKNRGSYDGLQPYCIDCAKALSQKRRDMRKAGILPVVTPPSKRCYDCNEDKPASAFAVCMNVVDGLQSICRDCAATRRRRARFGIEPQQFDELMKAQDGRCAICPRSFDEEHPPHVDHNHNTGRVRGLLCGRCNSALGLMDDLPDQLMAAAAYLIVNSEIGATR